MEEVEDLFERGRPVLPDLPDLPDLLVLLGAQDNVVDDIGRLVRALVYFNHSLEFCVIAVIVYLV